MIYEYTAMCMTNMNTYYVISFGSVFSGINQWCIIECEKYIPAEIGDLGKSCIEAATSTIW